MTDAPDYAAIEAMAARTSMPWRAEIRNGGGATVYDGRHQMVATHLRAYTVDPELIVAAVNTLPALIARCRELEAKVAGIREVTINTLAADTDPVADGMALLRIHAILDSKDPT